MRSKASFRSAMLKDSGQAAQFCKENGKQRFRQKPPGAKCQQNRQKQTQQEVSSFLGRQKRRPTELKFKIMGRVVVFKQKTFLFEATEHVGLVQSECG